MSLAYHVANVRDHEGYNEMRSFFCCELVFNFQFLNLQDERFCPLKNVLDLRCAQRVAKASVSSVEKFAFYVLMRGIVAGSYFDNG